MLRRLFALPAAAALVAASATPAQAQACHGDVLDPSEGTRFSTTVAVVAGGFDRSMFGKGDFEGVTASLRLRAGGARWGVVVPAYRIHRGGSTAAGLGDVGLRAEIPAINLFDGALEFGVGVGLTLPTGSTDDELGMGHAMAMPWVFGAGRFGIVALEAELGTAHSLSSSGHTMTMPGMTMNVARPVVDPMNSNEVWASAAVSVPFGVLSLVPTLRGAQPIGDGEKRMAAGLGLRLPVGPVALAAGGELPVVGDPFTWRGFLRGTLSF